MVVQRAGARAVGHVVVALSIAVATITGTAAQVASELKARFERRVQEIAAHVDGVVGYEMLDLASGDRFSHLAGETFPTASTIKIAIVYELFEQVDDGRVRLDEPIVLDRTKAVGGTGVLVHLGTPTLSIGDYATLMVTLSDNTATNVLIDRLGMTDITKRMQALGLPGTKLRRHMMDTAAARRGDENVSTPAELVRLLMTMHGPSSAKPLAMEPAIELLKKPKESRLRKGLPDGVAAADKPGELDGVRVDAGIVFAKNRPYVFAVMMTFLRDEGEGERAMVELSRTAYEYFSRLGAGELGRRFDN
jgi:beta-lactamase class A